MIETFEGSASDCGSKAETLPNILNEFWCPRTEKHIGIGQKYERYKFRYSDTTILPGFRNVRGLGNKGLVKVGGQLYMIKGRACDLPNCQCDNIAVITTPEGWKFIAPLKSS